MAFYEGFVSELDKVALLGRVAGHAAYRLKEIKKWAKRHDKPPVADPSASRRLMKKPKTEAK